MRANRLTQITIKYVSLVAAGANRREFIAKADGNFTAEARIVKLDEEKREVSGALYPTGQVDTQGDFATRDDWDLAMLDFQAKGRGAAGRSCDVNHDESPTGDYIAEVYRTVENDPRWPGEEPGTWIVTRKITDDERWAAVKDGTFKAFSFGGTAVRIPDVEVTKAADAALLKRQAIALLKGPLADALSRRVIPNLIEATYEALWTAYYDSPAGGETPALADVVAELSAELNKESGMDKTLLKKLADGIAALFAKAAEEAPADQTPPTPEAKSAEVLVTEAVAAAKAEHDAAVEALKAEHATALQTLNDEIARLERIAPPSGRIDHQSVPGGEEKRGGPFCG